MRQRKMLVAGPASHGADGRSQRPPALQLLLSTKNRLTCRNSSSSLATSTLARVVHATTPREMYCWLQRSILSPLPLHPREILTKAG